MTEIDKNGHEEQKHVPVNSENTSRPSENDSDIIELSDIAIGISREDDVIVELTEEIIGEAFVGFSGATSEVLQADERELDLSPARIGGAASSGELAADSSQKSLSGEDSEAIAGDTEADEADDISRELDNYFGTEEDRPLPEKPSRLPDSKTTEPATPPRTKGQSEAIPLEEIRISASHLDDAIERVIRKMFAEKINRVLDDVIERTVSEEISQLRDYLLGVSGKK